MQPLTSFGLILEKQASMTQSSSPLSESRPSKSLRAGETPATTLDKSTRTPTPEQWQAHAGVIVNDALGIAKLLSVPLFIFGLYRMASEGVITAGLSHVVPWPILETLTRKETNE